jgi:hypothetical protein
LGINWVQFKRTGEVLLCTLKLPTGKASKGTGSALMHCPGQRRGTVEEGDWGEGKREKVKRRREKKGWCRDDGLTKSVSQIRKRGRKRVRRPNPYDIQRL